MTTIANGTICKLGLLHLEADKALQWGAALVAAAEEYRITSLAQGVWLANVMTATRGLTDAAIMGPSDTVQQINEAARAFAYSWSEGWRIADSVTLQHWHKRVSEAMGI